MLDNFEFDGRTIAILCLMASACIFLVVLALLLDARRGKQTTPRATASAPERANETTLLVPIANPTKGAVAAPRAKAAGPPAPRDARPQAVMQQQAVALGNEVRRLRSDISTLRQQSDAILKQNAQLSTLNTTLANQAKAAAQRANTSEADLKLARKDIAEIREYVLHLGGAKGVKDVIDLR